MTADTTASNSPFEPTELVSNLRNGFAMFLKVIMGGLVVLAAGILAVALAMVGLLLAAIAVVYRMVARRPNVPTSQTYKDGIILEARRTAHGWTVE